MLVFVMLGPEAHGSHFEQARVGFQDGSGVAATTELVDGHYPDGKAELEHQEVEGEVKR